ncbi:MAG: ABC transporter permease, partial [Mesorhizobium sp.]|nr:ABC transporter permease [Mesorhizobium sp.]
MTELAVRPARGGAVVALLKRFPMEIIFLCLVAVLVMVAPGFDSTGNLLNVLRTISMLGIIAFGMTAVIVAGEIDLSVGSGAALAGCIVAWFAGAYSDTIGAGLSVFLGAAVAVLVGFLTGLVTGKVRQHFNVPTFIATLAMFTALRGAANLITG